MARHEELWRLLLRGEAPAHLSPALYAAGPRGRSARSATPIWRSARGVWVRDAAGRRLLDFTSGLGAASIGHAHPAVVKALRAQAARLLHAFGDLEPHESRARLAAALSDLGPWPETRVLWAQSGSGAVELALQTAFLATGRSGVLAFRGGYHGDSLGALEVSGFPSFRRPFVPLLRRRTVWGDYPDCARCPLGLRHPSCRLACVDRAFERADRFSRRTPIGAVLMEPILGRGGTVIPPRGALRAVRDRARERGWLVLFDEIFTGFGRTGQLFAFQHEGVRPDLLCVGKALGGGLPIAAVLGPRRLLEAWRRVSSGGEAAHSATFLAHPLACAAALAALDVLRSERLVERSRRLGAALLRQLERLREALPAVRHARGRGLFAALDFGGDGVPPATARARASGVVSAALRQGLLVLGAGLDRTAVQLCPPLVLSREELALGVRRLERALGEARLD